MPVQFFLPSNLGILFLCLLWNGMFLGVKVCRDG